MAESNNDRPVSVIAGVSGGIGSCVARRMAAKGDRIAGFARDNDKLEKLGGELSEARLKSVDATDSEAVNAFFKEVLDTFGRVDRYIHCVGSILLKSAHMIRDEEWSEVLRTNLDSAFFGLRAAAKPMQKAGAGSIVLVSTVAARAGLPSHEGIGAAKAGVEGLALGAAASYASRGVRVNVVAPGMTETPMSAPMLQSDQARAISQRMHALGRVGQPDELAAAICFLAGDDAGWITGQIFGVDGGLSTIHPRPKA